MNKKLLAAAVAGLFAAPFAAWAQTAPPSGSVQIYGTLNTNFQTADRKGATAAGTAGLASLAAAPTGLNAASRNAISVDSSNLGFRGTENLGNGWKANFQIETSANIDGDNQRPLANRNSKVGLAGDFGEVFFGNWDTPFKAATYGNMAQDPFRMTDVFGYQSIMSSPGFNQRSGAYSSGTDNASFDNRAANTLNYWTRVYNGFSGRIAYSANEGRTATRNPSLWSAVVNYNSGPLSLLYAYEQHRDAFGLTAMQATSTGTASDDKAHRVGAGYLFGGTTVSAVWERLDFKNSGTVAGVTNFKRDAWQLGLLHRAGNHEFKLRYNKAQDGACGRVAGNCSTSGLGAQQWTLGYGYYFSKRTEGFVFHTRLNNDRSASYTFTVGGAPGVSSSAGVGSDPSATGIGIRHTF
jgi:predicted porin